MSRSVTRRYGLIGAGAMGQVYLQALSEVDGAELAAVAEPNSDPLTWTFQTLRRSRHSPAIYSDWAEMLDTAALDAVIVATPSDMHTEIAGAVLRVPRHLLIEAPVCTTARDRSQLARLQARSDAIVHAGLAFRHDALVMRLLDRIQAGEIGQPYMVAIRQHQGMARQSIDNWVQSDARAGGLLVDAAGHAFDMMCQLFGCAPERVYASAGRHPHEGSDAMNDRPAERQDNAFVMLDFPGHARAQLDLCEYAFEADPCLQVRVTGTRGQLSAELPAGEAFATVVTRLRAFHHVMVTGDRDGASLQDGLRAVDIALAAQQSAASGKAVTL